MDIRPIDANAPMKKRRMMTEEKEAYNVMFDAIPAYLVDGVPTLSLNTLRDAIYQDAVEHGLWEEHDYYYSQMEEVQAQCPEAEIDVAMEGKEHCARLIEAECYELAGASEDTEQYAEELADVIIMSMSVAGKLGIDIDAAIRRKMEINKQRPWKHGKE